MFEWHGTNDRLSGSNLPVKGCFVNENISAGIIGNGEFGCFDCFRGILDQLRILQDARKILGREGTVDRQIAITIRLDCPAIRYRLAGHGPVILQN